LSKGPDVVEIKTQPWQGFEGLQSSTPKKFVLPDLIKPDFDEFLHSIKDREVLIRTGNYGHSDNDQRTRFSEYKSVEDLIAMLETYRNGGGKFDYPPGAPNQLSSWKEIEKSFGLSLKELERFGTSPSGHNTPPRFWISPKGGVTGLHFDTRDNFIIQLTGIKRWTLIHPKFWKYAKYRMGLPPMAIEGKVVAGYIDKKLQLLRTYSPTLRTDDPRQWQNTVVVDVHPGEVLHLPAFWGHHVEVLEDCLMINQWWDSVYSLGYTHTEKGEPIQKLKKERQNEVTRSIKYLRTKL